MLDVLIGCFLISYLRLCYDYSISFGSTILPNSSKYYVMGSYDIIFFY